MNTKFFTVRKSTAFALVLSVLFSLLLPFSSLTVYASPAELLTEEELLRLSFQVIEGGAVDSRFTGFEVIEGGLSVANKEAMVSSFGSQILASAKALGYNIAIAGGVAVTEYVALEVGYHALDAIMDSSAGDEITKLWLNTFSTCAYNGISSLATEKAVLKSNMLGELEDLLNIHYNGDFELNAGLVGNDVALGSDYFQNASASGVEAYKALNSDYQATFVFNGSTSNQFMSHYFVNGASYGIIENGTLKLYTSSGELCTVSNSSGKCTTSFILGNTFYGLSTYSAMTSFSISLGSAFQMISGAGIKLYEGSIDTPITSTVASPISQPDTAITLPSSITVPLDTDSALAIANGEAEADINTDVDSSTDTATDTSGFWATLWDWLKSILNGILAIPTVISNGVTDIVNGIKAIPEAVAEAIASFFIPSETALADTQALLDEKLPVMTQLYSWVEDLMFIMQNPNDYASTLSFDVDMSKAENTYWDWGDSKSNALDVSWYTSRYKSSVDDIVVGIGWLIFLWNLHAMLPSIISCVSTVTFTSANADYQKNNADLKRSEMEFREENLKFQKTQKEFREERLEYQREKLAYDKENLEKRKSYNKRKGGKA